ncbi:MAG: hypothetical protein JEY94_11870 [Melioribacteraceae bacterium]|nr:hypothetical protein [Melioribacteraceae bacterium]
MKFIGCFLKSAALLIVIIGISFYLYQKYEDDIYDFGKGKVEDYFTEVLSEKINILENSEIKDSVNVLFNDYIDVIKEKSISETYETSKEFFNKIEDFLDDKQINKEELLKLKKYINDAKSEKD